MISINFKRTKDDGCKSETAKIKSVKDALGEIIMFDIGYSCEIVSVSETTVVTKVLFLSCEDITTYSGSVKDMELLVSSARLASFLSKRDSDNNYKDHVDKILQITKGNPFFNN